MLVLISLSCFHSVQESEFWVKFLSEANKDHCRKLSMIIMQTSADVESSVPLDIYTT